MKLMCHYNSSLKKNPPTLTAVKPGKFWTGRKDTACCLLLEAGGAHGSGDVGVHSVVGGIETGVEAGAASTESADDVQIC